MNKNGVAGHRTQTFYVLGNGPSLTPRIIQSLPDGQWLGMNAAFRYWQTIGKYPRYYACLDPVVVKSQFDGIRSLLERPEIEAFFLHDCVVELDKSLSSHSKVTLLSNFVANQDLSVPLSRLALQKQTTGALASRFVIERGHRDLMLIGIDCKYVERLAESAQTQGIELVITKQVDNNPNYFFSGYQATGDKYQVPNPAVHTGNLHLQSFIALQQDLDDSEVDARITVGSQRSLLSRFGVFPTVSIWKALNIRRIGAVAVPLTPGEWRRQVENIALWLDPKLRPSLQSGARATALHLFFSGAIDQVLEQEFRDSIARLPELREYFAEVRITFLSIPPEIDHYVRKTAGSDEPCTKSGPNVFFLATMAHCKEYEYVLHIETDCLPVRAGWLDAAEGEIDRAGTQAWIIGPAYLQRSNLHSSFRLHINGNAIYQTGDPDFQQFLQSTFFEALSHLIRSGFRDMAYDTALSVLMYNLQALPPALRHALMVALPRFAFSHFIRNVGGTLETANPALVDVRGILEESDATFMMHGRPAFHHLDQDRSFLPSFFCRSQWQAREEMPLFWASGWKGSVAVTFLGYGEVEIRPKGVPAAERIGLSFNSIRLTSGAGKRRFEATFVWPGSELSEVSFIFVLRNRARESRRMDASGWRYQSVSHGTRVEAWLDAVDAADATTVELAVSNLPYEGNVCSIRQARMDERFDRSDRPALVPMNVATAPPSEAASRAIERWRGFYSELPRVTSALQPLWLHWESGHFLCRHLLLEPGLVDMLVVSQGLPAEAKVPAFVCVISALNWRNASRFSLLIRMSLPVSGEAVLRLCRHGHTPWEYRDIAVTLQAGLGVLTLDGPLFNHDHTAYRLELLRCTPIDSQFTMQVLLEWPELPVVLDSLIPAGQVSTRKEPLPSGDARSSSLRPARVLVIDPTLIGSPSATGQIKRLFFRDWPLENVAQVWEPFSQDGRFAFAGMAEPLQRTLHGSADLLGRCLEFDPDVVYVRPDDNLGFLEAAVRLCEGLARPVLLHIMDDWMERARLRDRSRWLALTGQLRTLADQASVHLSICPSMSAMLEARYGHSWQALANGVPMPDGGQLPECLDHRDVFVIRYMGGLAKDMSRASVHLVAQAVQRLSERWPVRFEIHTMEWYLNDARILFKDLPTTTVAPLVDAADYAETLKSSGAVLIAYNFDAESIAYTRYSFSNKLPECLASGRPVILIGPPEVATVRELGEEPGLVCIDRPDLEEVVQRIERLLTSRDFSKQLAADAAKLLRKRFLADDVVGRMDAFVCRAADPSSHPVSVSIADKELTFTEANQLHREGSLVEAFHAYVKLITERDLPVYRDNARLCLRRLGVDETSLEHAVAVERSRSVPAS